MRLSYQNTSTRSRAAYISFDIVPAPKGAATHIEAFARAFGGAIGPIELVTIAPGSTPMPAIERWPGVLHTELPAIGPSLIDRVLCFRRYLSQWLQTRRFEAIQFRSIFEGLPLITLRDRPRLIFEVNGLPSIELKYRYPKVGDDRELMRKIVSQEQTCFEAADRIVTPSGVTMRYLSSKRGVALDKIRVIPNGVFPLDRVRAPKSSGQFSLLYFGTLAAWQGVDLAVRAMAVLRDRAKLTVIGTGTNNQRDALHGLAAKLGIANRVEILPPLTQTELAEHLLSSDAVLVPLTINDRNIEQGCCPLKILEGMAAGVPVIASDLPVVRELGCDGQHFLLVKPGSVDQIADAVLRLQSDRALAQQIGGQARAHVEAIYTWQRAGDALVAVYRELNIA